MAQELLPNQLEKLEERIEALEKDFKHCIEWIDGNGDEVVMNMQQISELTESDSDTAECITQLVSDNIELKEVLREFIFDTNCYWMQEITIQTYKERMSANWLRLSPNQNNLEKLDSKDGEKVVSGQNTRVGINNSAEPTRAVEKLVPATSRPSEQLYLCEFPNCDKFGIKQKNNRILCEQHYIKEPTDLTEGEEDE